MINTSSKIPALHTGPSHKMSLVDILMTLSPPEVMAKSWRITNPGIYQGVETFYAQRWTTLNTYDIMGDWNSQLEKCNLQLEGCNSQLEKSNLH